MEKTENELIAEFMGILFDESGQCTDPEHKYSWRPGVYDPLRVDHLQYDTNWSWLMPVVEKIQSLGYGFSLKVLPIEETIAMYFHPLEARNRHSMGSMIDNVYNATVEFIKWYNSQKP